MHGPELPGHWTASIKQSAFKQLEPRRRFVVSEKFSDFDGDVHAEGESWEFLGHNFMPHDDGLSLFVSLDGHSEWHIRMQWRPEQQGPIIDDLSLYIRPAAI